MTLEKLEKFFGENQMTPDQLLKYMAWILESEENRKQALKEIEDYG